MFKIFYGDSELVFTDNSVGSEEGTKVLPSGESFANIVENLEKYKHVTVLTPDVEGEVSGFMGNFRSVDAAGGLVSNSHGELLMIHRNGRWDLPKGHREKGEDMLTCALREVEEETAVFAQATAADLLIDTFHFYLLGDQWVLKHTYWYAMKADGTGSPIPQTVEGIVSVEWVPRAEVRGKGEDCFPSVREVLRAGGWL